MYFWKTIIYNTIMLTLLCYRDSSENIIGCGAWRFLKGHPDFAICQRRTPIFCQSSEGGTQMIMPNTKYQKTEIAHSLNILTYFFHHESNFQFHLESTGRIDIFFIPIYIKWGWCPFNCKNDLICNLHQTYSVISVIHSMLKQYYRSRIFTKCVN